jgi:hypothetical protein
LRQFEGLMASIVAAGLREVTAPAGGHFQGPAQVLEKLAGLPEPEKGDALLVEMLTSAVESREGVRPDLDDVAKFLAGLGKPIIVEAPRGRPIQTARGSPPPKTLSWIGSKNFLAFKKLPFLRRASYLQRACVRPRRAAR